ncbi:MAG: GspE/PulE family protein [Gaiellaceae bacterium]
MREPLPAPLPFELEDTRPLLGRLLVDRGFLTLEQLEEALVEKESTGARIGEIVVARGWLSETDVAGALAEQHELEFIELSKTDVDASAALLLPEKFARRYGALPVCFLDEDSVLVAIADPTNVLTADDLRLAFGLNVKLAVVAASELEKTIARVYRSELDLDQPLPDEPDESTPTVTDIREGAATSAPAIQLVNQLIARAIDEGASDVHFEPQANQLLVRARIDGVMRALGVVQKSMQAAVTSRLKIMGELDIADRRLPQDGRVSIRLGGVPMDLRIAVLPTTYGEQVVLRILRGVSGRLAVEDLGFNPEAHASFLRAIRQPYGAVLAVGPTGAGKTTTLYAALDHLNDPDRVLMTIEDPVETQIPGVNQIEVTPKAGLTFARGLRTILRSDPDVLLVGEIRDEETARIAIRAAMTGHLVLTTLHAHNAAASIARLKDMGVEPSLLATSINCIVAQRLARRLCLDCREAYEPPGDELKELGLEHGHGLTLYRTKGCVACANTGYAGRVALYEVLNVHGRIRRHIEATTEEIFAAAVEEGMTTLRQDGIRVVLEGVSSLDEIRRVTGDRLQ